MKAHPVTLVGVEADVRHPTIRREPTLGPQAVNEVGHVIENAEPFTPVRLGVVVAAGQVHRQSVGQRRASGYQRPGHGPAHGPEHRPPDRPGRETADERQLQCGSQHFRVAEAVQVRRVVNG